MAERLANIYSEAAALEALLQQAQSECTAIAKQIEQMRGRAPTGAAECKQLGDEAAGAITAMAASAPASDDREVRRREANRDGSISIAVAQRWLWHASQQ